jgi:hypothetical protein
MRLLLITWGKRGFWAREVGARFLEDSVSK